MSGLKNPDRVYYRMQTLEISSFVNTEWLSLDFNGLEAGYAEFSFLWLQQVGFSFKCPLTVSEQVTKRNADSF